MSKYKLVRRNAVTLVPFLPILHPFWRLLRRLGMGVTGSGLWAFGYRFSTRSPSCVFIVIRGDWLGNPANIKVENNGAVVYVGSSLTVDNPLFSLHKL